MRSTLLLPIAVLAGVSLAHFEVRYPDSIGFRDADEDEAPCGGFTPDLSDSSKLVDFHVGGDAIAVRSTHQQGNWLIRVTLDEKAESDWEQVFPIVQQSGLGDYCNPAVTIPESYVGKKGVIGVVSSATDGVLYQVRLHTLLSVNLLLTYFPSVYRRQLCQGQGRQHPQRVPQRVLG